MSSEPVYRVFVDDNFHYMDEEERYELGAYADSDAAIAVCKGIVDRFLAHSYEAGMTAEALWQGYRSFGEDPFIRGEGVESPKFSAWTYAKQRCEEICGSNQDR